MGYQILEPFSQKTGLRDSPRTLKKKTEGNSEKPQTIKGTERAIMVQNSVGAAGVGWGGWDGRWVACAPFTTCEWWLPGCVMLWSFFFFN